MIDIIDSSEIDFWNGYANCIKKVPENVHPDHSYNDISQIFIEVEFVLNRLKIDAYKGFSSTLFDSNGLTKDYAKFFEKIMVLSTSPNYELIALKALAQISAAKDIDSRNLFHKFGFCNWIEEMCSRDSPEIFLEAWKITHNLYNLNNYKYMEGIYPVTPPVSDNGSQQMPVVDIVLIHGIMGGAAWTWRQNDCKSGNPIISQKQRIEIFQKKFSNIDNIEASYTWIWPLDWLQLCVPKPIRLIAVDFPAFWWKWSNKCISKDKNLNSLSEEFLIKLKEAGIGSRPTIWITHSMGGLIVKRILDLENDQQSNHSEGNFSNLNLLSSTCGIVFLSVPHFGSRLASWCCLFSSIFKPSSFTCDLKADDPKLLVLHNKFLEYCDKYAIKVLTLNEGKTSQLIRNGPKYKIIPSRYGDPGIGEVYEVDASHLDICKPLNMSDQIFQLIKNFIITIMESL